MDLIDTEVPEILANWLMNGPLEKNCINRKIWPFEEEAKRDFSSSVHSILKGLQPWSRILRFCRCVKWEYNHLCFYLMMISKFAHSLSQKYRDELMQFFDIQPEEITLKISLNLAKKVFIFLCNNLQKILELSFSIFSLHPNEFLNEDLCSIYHNWPNFKGPKGK